MDSTPFVNKMNQVCEMQVASQDYIPIVVNEAIIRSMSREEVLIYFLTINSYFVRYTLLICQNIAMVTI